MTRRDRLALTIIAIAAALGAFWFLGLSGKRKDAANLRQQITQEQTRLDKAHTDLATYRAARGSYRTNYATVARLGKAVPADDDVPSLVYQLESTAESMGIDFRSLKVSAATPAPPAAATTPSSTGSSDSDASSSGTASATQTAAATAPAGTSIGAAGFPTMPFTFTFRGNFFRLSDFFGSLQRYIHATDKRLAISGRLLTLDGISFSAGPKGFPQIDANVSATAYLLPASEGLFNGAQATSPSTQPAAASGTASGSSSGGSSATPGTATAVGPN